jgi:hypothetical protein
MRALLCTALALIVAVATAHYQQPLYGYGGYGQAGQQPLYGQQSMYWGGGASAVNANPNPTAPLTTGSALVGDVPAGQQANVIPVQPNVPYTSPGPSGGAPPAPAGPAPAPAMPPQQPQAPEQQLDGAPMAPPEQQPTPQQPTAAPGAGAGRSLLQATPVRADSLRLPVCCPPHALTLVVLWGPVPCAVCCARR